jgi:hypothetical protein
MTRYVIERQFCVPVFEHIMIEAPDLISACTAALDEIAQPWGEHSTLCYEDARSVTVAQVVELPDDLLPQVQAGDELDHHTLNDLLYDSGLPLLAIPAELAGEPEVGEPVGFT